MKRSLGWLFALIVVAVPADGDSLYVQSLARVLEERFGREGISYLLFDVQTGVVEALRWKNPDSPVSPGSLVKPFLALAYGEANAYEYPEFSCRGSKDGCWLALGHGSIGIAEAVARSCNGYFLQLAGRVSNEDVSALMRRFGIVGPPEGDPARTLVGLGNGWRISPLGLARAYGELARRSGQPGVREILCGMALSARHGTGRSFGHALAGATSLVKTGTSPCLEESRDAGDGFAMALYPAVQPRFGLLVRLHGAPGPDAAEVACRILQTVLAGR